VAAKKNVFRNSASPVEPPPPHTVAVSSGEAPWLMHMAPCWVLAIIAGGGQDVKCQPCDESPEMQSSKAT